jgi:hypothetical protein
MTASEEKLLVSVNYNLDKFTQDWQHCGYSANYLAQLVSGCSTDPTKMFIMLSTVINELLEVIYYMQDNNNQLKIDIKQFNENLIVDFSLILTEEQHQMFDIFFKQIANKEAEKVYLSEMNRLKNGEDAHPFIGLFEIIADYNVQLVLKIQPQINVLRMTLSI